MSATDGPAVPGTARTATRRVLTALFPIAAAAGVAWAVHGQFALTARLLGSPRGAPFLLGAVAANAAGIVLSWVTWHVLLRDLGPRVRAAVSARIYFTSFLGKFVPGPMWGILAQLSMGRAAGVTAPVMLAVFLLNLVVAVVTGLVFGLVAAPWALAGQVWWLLLPAALTALWVARPGLVNHVAAAGARLARRPAPAIRVGDRATRRAIATAAASWLVSGLHIWLLALLFGAPGAVSLPVAMGGFAVPTAAASVVVVLPDGWGAREALLTTALTAVLPWQQAAAVALASRLVCLVSELLVAGAALVLTRTSGRPRPGDAAAPVPHDNPTTPDGKEKEHVHPLHR
jgi:hypothetical protein